MRYGRFAYLMPAVPAPCTMRAGQCLTHGLTVLGHHTGAWCPAALSTALMVARKYEHLAAQPPSGWWGQTAYRRGKWRKLWDEKTAAAAHIRRMAQT